MPGSVPVPAGWPSIKATYDNSITQKLLTSASSNAATDKQLKLAAIGYWMARLQRDQACISAGVPLDS